MQLGGNERWLQRGMQFRLFLVLDFLGLRCGISVLRFGGLGRGEVSQFRVSWLMVGRYLLV